MQLYQAAGYIDKGVGVFLAYCTYKLGWELWFLVKSTGLFSILHSGFYGIALVIGLRYLFATQARSMFLVKQIDL